MGYSYFERVQVTASLKDANDLRIPKLATHVQIQAETGNIRFTLDNDTNPTTTLGYRLLQSNKPVEILAEDIRKIRFIRETGSSVYLLLHYYIGTEFDDREDSSSSLSSISTSSSSVSTSSQSDVSSSSSSVSTSSSSSSSQSSSSSSSSSISSQSSSSPSSRSSSSTSSSSSVSTSSSSSSMSSASSASSLSTSSSSVSSISTSSSSSSSFSTSSSSSQSSSISTSSSFSSSISTSSSSSTLGGYAYWLYELEPADVTLVDESKADNAAPRVSGACMEFDGSTDYVTFGTDVVIAGEFTLVWWSKRSSTNTLDYVFGHNSTGSKFGFSANTTTMSVRVVDGGSITTIAHGVNTIVWHQYAITRDSNNKIDLYVDGYRVGRLFSDAAQLGELQVNKIACDNAAVFFHGCIVDAWIYSVCKTGTELAALFNATKRPGGNVASTLDAANLEVHYWLNHIDSTTTYGSVSSNHGTLSGTPAIHEGNDVPIAVENELGYSLISSVRVPPSSSNVAVDAKNAASLTYPGPLARPVAMINAPCGTFDGVDDKLLIPSLVGTETVVSSGGTAVPTVGVGEITFTAGTCWDLLLSNGDRYAFCEGDGLTVYNVTQEANHATVDGTTAGAFWAATQDEFFWNANYGFRDSGGVQIPAVVSGVCAADGNPITNPAGEWMNGSSNQYDFAPEQDAPWVRTAALRGGISVNGSENGISVLSALTGQLTNTISVYVRVRNINATASIRNWFGMNGAGANDFCIIGVDAGDDFYIWTDKVYKSGSITQNGDVASDWVDHLMVIDGDNLEYKHYLNGSQEGSTETIDVEPDFSTINTANILSHATNSANRFLGDIARIAVFNTAITPSQIDSAASLLDVRLRGNQFEDEQCRIPVKEYRAGHTPLTRTIPRTYTQGDSLPVGMTKLVSGINEQHFVLQDYDE